MPALVRVAVALLAAGVAVRLAYGLGLGRPALETVVCVWVYSAVMVGSALLGLARGVLVRRDRAAWLALGAGISLWAAGDLWYDVVAPDGVEVAFPAVGDAFYYASYPCSYAGLVLLLHARLRPLRASLWLDGLLCGLVLAALSAAVVVRVVVEAGADDLRTLAFTLAYPVGDGALLCLVAVAFALCAWRPGRAWALLGLGLGTMAVADSVYTYQASVGTYAPGTLVGALWPLAALLTSAAAWQPAGRRPRDDGGLRLLALPGVATVVAIGVLLAGAVGDVPAYASGLAAAALLVGVLRAGLAFRENARLLRASLAQAHTDGLTGLGNRRKLMDDLDDALGEDRVATLLFFDLNGFKAYNDAFGHSAGDALLRRLASALARGIAGDGDAYRLGGDEFCVLVGRALTADDPLLARADAALSEHGDGFAVSAARGLVLLPDEAATAGAALQLADERMYADKGGPTSGRAQVRDVLLQVLREREPALREHLDEVAALAGQLGRELRLEPETLDELTRAAELHDVGKMALPEALLGKPRPLTAADWAFVHEHTVVGERILGAAPALRPVARLVRSSHERWDGAGYPDGLAGEAIPLGARVIAVCDAFHAMTAGRPDRPPLAAQDALRELRRCAGTQFDPRVVEAFARVAVRGPLPAAGARC